MDNNKRMHHAFVKKFTPLLPTTYAFVSTSFWIFILCTGRIDFVIEKIASVTSSFLAIIYSLSALVFWLPYFRQKIYLSFLHSLVPFLFPIGNILLKAYRHKIIQQDYIWNLVLIYTAGLIIYLMGIVILFLLKWLIKKLLSTVQHQKESVHSLK
ncbi:MAG TPA: hypothetical protein VFW07_18240 [Parafilimonas sp.]|nr:hypothetical protein [Parafilimonas sp.]